MFVRKFFTTVPCGCKSHGFIYETDDPRELSEDMLDVELPDGRLITAGYYGEGYRVSLTSGLQEIKSVCVATAEECADAVTRMAFDSVVRPLIASTSSESGGGKCRVAG